MNSYLFTRLDETPERRAEYEQLLEKHSAAIGKSVELLNRVLQLIAAAEPDDQSQVPGVVFLLARHLAEEIDAVSILVSKGAVPPCTAHLRSAFEADLGIHFILEAECESRAVAYLVQHAHSLLRKNDRIDPSTQAGQELRRNISEELIGLGVLDSLPSVDFAGERQRLMKMLEHPEFAPIEFEWQNVRSNGRRPAWFGLFGGPRTIRELAYHLGRGFWYEFMYSDWSGRIHASAALLNIAKNTSDPAGGLKSFRPLRNPEGLGEVLTFAILISKSISRLLSQRFLSRVGQDDVREKYLKELKPLFDSVRNVQINADWR